MTQERTTVAKQHGFPPDRPKPPRKHSPYFFAREEDGSVRIRMRFNGDEASLFEEAAGNVPVVTWLHQALNRVAEQEVAARRSKQKANPPE